jgi:hypothetical protein
MFYFAKKHALLYDAVFFCLFVFVFFLSYFAWFVCIFRNSRAVYINSTRILYHEGEQANWERDGLGIAMNFILSSELLVVSWALMIDFTLGKR